MLMEFSLFILLVFLYGVNAADDWDYNNLEEWPALCQTGTSQSPIDIRKGGLKKEFTQRIQYQNYDRLHSATISNTGHSVEVKFNDDDHPIIIKNGILPGEYVLDHIHFHWGSEHTFNNKRYALETHMVHHLLQAGNLTNAFQIENGIVVLATLSESHPKTTTEGFGDVANSVADIASLIDEPSDIGSLIRPNDFLPNNIKNYFLYRGSLTTPNCTEGIHFLVYENQSRLKSTELNLLTKIFDSDGDQITQSFRPTQDLNGRTVRYISEK